MLLSHFIAIYLESFNFTNSNYNKMSDNSTNYNSDSSGALEYTFLTRNETASLLKVSLPTLHSWTTQDLLVSYHIGGRVLYLRSEVMDALFLSNSKGKHYKG